MKILLRSLFLSIFFSLNLGAQNYEKKVKTIDSTIETLYKVISGEKGEARNWELFKYLFHKDARLMPSGNNRQGVSGIKYLSTDQYIESSGKWLIENGFFEKEIGRKTDQFGSMAQVFSTYESYKSAADTKPFMRGINSIQLLYDGKRWWILNIFWQGETKDQPIPEKYLNNLGLTSNQLNRQMKHTIGRIDKADFPELNLVDIDVKIDSGAFTSSIHCEQIEEFEKEGSSFIRFILLDPEHSLYKEQEFSTKNYTTKLVKSSNGLSEERFAIQTQIVLFDQIFPIDLTLSQRKDMKFPILLGRKFLNHNFVIDPSKKNVSHKLKSK